MDQDAPFFIVGCARSGTSLLRDLLRSHPRLFIDRESHFLPWLHASHGDPADEAAAIALGGEILRVLRRQGFHTELSPEDFARCRSYAEAAALPFRAAAETAGKSRWGDKTPHYVLTIPQIRTIFPAAQFVHIVRDGRDVARSLLRRNFGPNTVYTAALTWRARARAGIDAGVDLGSGVVHEVRYEELLDDPEKVLRGILDFLGEEFDPAVLERSLLPFLVRKPLFGAARAPSTAPGRIDPSRALRWRTAMSKQDQALFESVAGDLLEELGYEVRGLARPIGRLERAWWRFTDARRRLWLRFRYGQLGPYWLRQRWIERRARAKGLPRLG